MSNELEKSQPTEMIVLPKGEYDLLRERAVGTYYDDEIDLIDLILIPFKRSRILIRAMLVGLLFGVGLFIWKKYKSPLELAYTIQSGELYYLSGASKTFNPKSIYDQLYAKSLLAKLTSNLTYGAYQVKTVALSESKSETQVQFFKENIDNIKGPDLWFTAEAELAQPELAIYEVKLYLHNSKSPDYLTMLNRELLKNILKKQQKILDLNKKEYENFKKEYRELLSFDLTKDQSGVIFNRIKQLEVFLERYELFIERESSVLNVEEVKPKKVSKAILILPCIGFSFLGILLTFAMEFFQKADIVKRLKSLKNQ